jgi:hypothetical protein
MNNFKKSYVIAAGIASTILVPVPVMAQASEDKSQMPSNAASAVCMARPLSDTSHVSASQRGQPFRILANELIAPSLEAKGFTRVDCKVADLVLANKRDGWRDQICELSAYGNEAVQKQIERGLGENAAVLCASAEAVVGPWQRRSGEAAP